MSKLPGTSRAWTQPKSYRNTKKAQSDGQMCTDCTLLANTTLKTHNISKPHLRPENFNNHVGTQRDERHQPHRLLWRNWRSTWTQRDERRDRSTTKKERKNGPLLLNGPQQKISKKNKATHVFHCVSTKGFELRGNQFGALLLTPRKERLTHGFSWCV